MTTVTQDKSPPTPGAAVKIRKRIAAILSGVAAVAVLSAGCCNRTASIGVVVGSTIPRDQTLPTDVWICPGTAVTLGWKADKDFTSGKIDPLGSVTLPSGSQMDTPQSTTDYKLNVSGNSCTMDRTATVHVVKDGDTAHVSLSLVQSVDERTHTTLYSWQTTLPPSTWDPKIIMTSIAMDPFPPSQPSVTIWNTPIPWGLNKHDLNNTVHAIPVGWSPSTPWGVQKIQVAGTYAIAPGPGQTYPNANLPPFANIQLTLACP